MAFVLGVAVMSFYLVLLRRESRRLQGQLDEAVRQASAKSDAAAEALRGELVCSVENESLRQRLEESATERGKNEARLDRLVAERDEQLRAVSVLSAEKQILTEKADFQKSELENLRRQMSNEFRVMADSILEEKSRRFTTLNSENMDKILSPLQEKLNEFKKKVEETYDRESKERFSLDSRIRELVELNRRISDEANNLTRALKGDNKAQGDWGEMILENILEMSGLTRDREYFRQPTLTDDLGHTTLNEQGNRMRPDYLVVYPDQRSVIIDSKVSLTAYCRYIETDDKTQADVALVAHVRSMKAHIDELAAKSYQDYCKSLDFVMMFMPNEAAYLAAMQYDHTLWEYAYAKRVLLISPTNLIAALKLVADLWKREYQNRNALEIAQVGATLYDKLVGFESNLRLVGEGLEKTMRNYETAYKQLTAGRGNMVDKARRMKELGLKTKKEFPALLGDDDDEPAAAENEVE